ncbi:MAG TPA: histidine kinase dimerization/phospho-acceptor domain-containing protein, partial [Actinomycetota bacterium]|nr:histidine kinase dimerization/phospho-acceptor domain-containing protein [Actinomycetota bacterium]
MRSAIRHPALAIRFAGASLVVFLAVGIAAHTVVRQQVQAEDQKNAQFNAVFVTDSVLAPIFQRIDLSAPVSESVATGIRASLQPLLGARIKRVKLWRSDGTIIFSDEPRLIGRRFDAADDFAATKDGPHSEVTDLTDPENAFERGLAPTMFSTYLRLPGTPQLMLELYQDYGPTQAAINHTVGELDLALVSALLLLYLLVLPISARTSRSLRATNEALSSTNEALTAREEQLSSALERERAALERLRSVDDLKNMILTSVSHEMRTPLTSILGFASTLKQHQRQLEPALQSEIAERIHEQSERLQRLLGDLLDV